jgi:hypothetical protein
MRVMMIENKKQIQEYLLAMRSPVEVNGSLYSSRNSSKGALLVESEILFSYLAKNNCNLDSARNAVIRDNILAKRTYQTRKRCWAVLHSRYFPNKFADGHLNPIIAIYKTNASETMKRGVLYYHFATSDLFTYEVTTRLIYSLIHKGFTNISPRIIDDFLDSRAESHPEINSWSYQTRKSLISHYLSALRDFGILEGKARKRVQRPIVEEALFLYVATVLRDCGKSSRDILASNDFKLFLLTPAEVEIRFVEAYRNKRIEFKKSGKIISLKFPWETIHDYIKTLG